MSVRQSRLFERSVFRWARELEQRRTDIRANQSIIHLYATSSRMHKRADGLRQVTEEFDRTGSATCIRWSPRRMSELIDQRSGLRMFLVDSVRDLDFTALGRLCDGAWRTDKSGRVRHVYDEDYYRWLLGGDDWIGVQVLDDASQLVACVFSLFRTLQRGEHSYPAVYSSSLAVLSSHRGGGVGKWVVSAQRGILFERCKRHVGFAMSQSVHGGGLPTINASLRSEDNMHARYFHRASIWSRRLVGPLNDGEPPRQLKVSELVRDGSALHARPCSNESVQPPTLAAYAELCARGASLAFAPAESYARLYLAPSNSRAGTLWYQQGEAVCGVAFSTIELAIDDLRLGALGQIQCLQGRGCTAQELGHILRDVNRRLRQRGCIAVSIFDQGYVPSAVLEQAGFAKTQDELTIGIRARPALIEEFNDLKTPYSLDFF